MTQAMPIVDYLALDGAPHLVVNQCTACGARFFDRRNACASCGGDSFEPRPLPTTGRVRAFTVVEVAPPGVDVPFVAALVECDGATVRTTLVDVPDLPRDPDGALLGTEVELVTYSLGSDQAGVEGIGFAFRPVAA